MTDPDPRISYSIVAILIYLAAWFAVTETAIAGSSKSKLKTASEHGDYRADDALFALENFDRAITTILICTNIIHIAAASIVTVTVTRCYGVSWVSLSTVITTLAVFFFGEMLPKSIAKKNPEKYAMSHAGLLVKCMVIFKPVSSMLAGIGGFAAKITKSEPEVSVTEDELHDIIDDMEEEGTLDEDESDLLQSAIEFGDQKVNSIITPREKIVYIDLSDESVDVLEFLKSQTHSKIPVCDGSIDNVIGILQTRDYFKAYLSDPDGIDIRCLLSKPMIISRNYNIDDILELMSGHKSSIAIVKNRKNKVIGLVSTEDILEELVGEIWDEDEIVEEKI